MPIGSEIYPGKWLDLWLGFGFLKFSMGLTRYKLEIEAVEGQKFFLCPVEFKMHKILMCKLFLVVPMFGKNGAISFGSKGEKRRWKG